MKRALKLFVLLILLVLPFGALADFALPADLTVIEAEAFLNDAGLTGTLTLPEGVTAIGESAFSGCTGLTKIVLPASVKSIGTQAFSGCTGLTGTLVISKDVTVAENAFAGCDNLTVTVMSDATPAEYFTYEIADGEVTITGLAVDEYGAAVVIPDTIEGYPVTAIADDAFKSCNAASITIPASVTSIGQTVFYASYSLTGIHVEAANPAYKSVDGVLMTKDGSMLICCPAAYPAATYVIPDTVTSLDIYAFAYCQRLTEVILPDALTEISERAFFYCWSMPSITIPDSVTAIGTDAFAYCEALTEIDLPASVQSIGNGAFDCCSSLTTVSIPSTLTSLGSFVFSGCTSLTDIFVDEGNPYYASHDGILMSKDGTTLMIHPAGRTYTSFTVPETVTYLDGGAFSGCVNLESITLPDTLTFLTNFVFSNCTNLTSINIPASVTGIHVYAFNGCYNLTVTVTAGSFGESWAIEKNIPYIVTGAAATPAESFTYTIENGEVTITGLSEGVELTEVVIPDTIEGCPVTTISWEAFWYSTFSSIVIPEGVTTIQDRAFCFNENLSSVSIPSTMTNMDNECFYGCSALTSLDIAEDHPVYTVQNGMIIKKTTKTVVGYLYGYNAISTDMVVPEGVEVIGQYGLRYCEWMTSLSLPSTLKRIEACAFSFDENLTNNVTSLTIPESVEYIGYWAFGKWQNLITLNVSPDIACIDELAFGGCINLTGTLEFSSSASIHADAFASCPNLTVKIAQNATDASCFTYEIVDGEVTITGLSEGVELTEIVIPDTIEGYPVTAIGFEAFMGNETLTSVTLPEGLKLIDSWAFQTCRSLVSVNLPSTLTTINNCAFVGCSSLTSLTIPEGMTEISDGVFSSCSALTTLKLPSTLKTISTEAFSSCALTSVTIPEGVTKIGTHAFSFNESLSYVKIPSTLTDMDGESFSFCSSLASLDIAADHPVYSIQNGLIIRKDTKTVTSHLDSYSSVSTDIVVPEGIEVIGSCALRYCDWATSVTLPSTLKRIEEIAFGFDDGSNSITSLTIPESVEYIGYWAFGNWHHLTELNISPDISYIDDRAFAYCFSLAGTLEFSSNALIHAEAFAGCDDLTVTVKVAQGDTPAALFNYTIADGAVTITGFKNPMGYTDITIPAVIEGLPVTAIADSAFEVCPSLTSITVPEGVTAIGNYAFASCNALASVTLPSTVTSVGYGIISYSAVTEVNVAADHPLLGFSDGMLYDKTNMRLIAMIIPSGTTQLTIPGTIRTIGRDSINAQGITNLTLSEGVTAIESYGIRYAYNLTALTVPSTLMELQSNAVSGAYNLRTTLTLPNGAKVAENAFPDSRVTITFASAPEEDTPAEYFYYQELETNVIIRGYNGPETITTVRIPAEINGKPVTVIDGSFMFMFYPNVTTVYVPEGVTELGTACFRQSRGLEHVYLPSTLTTIGDNCFVWCDKLQSIEIPDSVTSLGTVMFGECYSMATCKLPSGLKTLPERTFSNCTGLQELTLPDGLEKIDTWAFQGAALDTLVLPDSVTTLAESALYWANIRSLTLSANLTELPAMVLGNNYTLESLVVPEGVTSIGSEAFSNCYNLKSISLPSTLTSIGAGAFNSCQSLTDVSIHEDNPVFAISNGALLNGKTGDMLLLINGIAEDGSYTVGSDVKSISANVFANNSNLTSIVIPEGVTTIGERAFSWCTELTSVSLPSTVTSIAENAFEACSKLSTITVAEGNEHYSITDSMLVSADKTLLVPIGGLTASSFTVPEGIVRIGNSAFRNAFDLSSISLPSTLTSIGDYAFANAGINTGISSFIMPDTVTSIGECAFFGASISTIHLSSSLTDIPREAFESSRLTEVVLPDSIQSVGQYAFGSCESLTSITLNEGLTTLGFGAFAYCPNVQEIYIPASVTSIDDWAFGVTQENATFIVHRGSAAEEFCQWNGFTYVYVAADCTPVEQLTYTATETAVTITGYTGTDTFVTLPAEIDGLPVTAIGDSAFAGSAITAIIFPSALESVGAYAFDGCSALVEATLPDGLLSIGDYAFRGCSALEYGILHIPGTVQTIGTLIADKNIVLSIVPGTPGETYALENGYTHGC